MRVAIVGAGANGTWLGVRLAKAGSDVSINRVRFGKARADC